MPTIHFVNEKKQIQVPAGANLRREARRAGIQLYRGKDRLLNCHGFGQCGSCRVLIAKGMDNTNPRPLIERIRMWFSMAYVGNEGQMRLSCQTKVLGDVEVVTQPELNLFGENFFS